MRQSIPIESAIVGSIELHKALSCSASVLPRLGSAIDNQLHSKCLTTQEQKEQSHPPSSASGAPSLLNSSLSGTSIVRKQNSRLNLMVESNPSRVCEAVLVVNVVGIFNMPQACSETKLLMNPFHKTNAGVSKQGGD